MWLQVLAVIGCGDGGFADPSRAFGPEVGGAPSFASVVEAPTTLGVVDTPLRDVHGTPIGVGCATCHGPTPEQSWAATPGEPFHTGVALRHGENACDHCHAADRTLLKLADGETLSFGESIRLCGQCHGTQKRDFDHGAHGGMNGWWDLRRGPRTRNHCVACHAPHTPAYEPVMPVHPPRDRYLETSDAH